MSATEKPLSKTQQTLVTHFGDVYARPEYSRKTEFLMFERDLRHYLAWGVRLGREQLVIMQELLASMDFCAGKNGNFFVETGSRALQADTKIHRRNAEKTIKELIGKDLLAIESPGRPRENAEDEGEPAVYDLKPLFFHFGKWLDAGKPAAQPKPRGRRKLALKAA
jgi:hypothetical protein